MRAHRGFCAEGFTRDETRPKPARLERWQIFGAVVLEVRSGLFKFFRQAHPGLETMHFPALAARALEALGVRDAAAGRHPVDLPRTNRLFRAQAVAMHDLAVE